MRSEAETVEAYLASLPPSRREAISAVRDVILASLPAGYVETMNWGMIAYEVPLATFPDTYNGKPLLYAALASQKNHMAVYLTGIYMDDGEREAFERAYRSTGKRLDAGKSCIRFRSVDDLPMPLIGDAVAKWPVHEFVDAVRRAGSVRKAKGR